MLLLYKWNFLLVQRAGHEADVQSALRAGPIEPTPYTRHI